MTQEKGLLLTNLQVIHADENFGAELSDAEKKSTMERYIEFSFDEMEVSKICKWLDIWFSAAVNRKINRLKVAETIFKGNKELEISLNYNNYTFFTETVRYNKEAAEKVKEIVK